VTIPPELVAIWVLILTSLVWPRMAGCSGPGTVPNPGRTLLRRVTKGAGGGTRDEFTSPLAGRPYDLRRAAASLWLRAVTAVARQPGHGVSSEGPRELCRPGSRIWPTGGSLRRSSRPAAVARSSTSSVSTRRPSAHSAAHLRRVACANVKDHAAHSRNAASGPIEAGR
jgi:hypothetical protein